MSDSRRRSHDKFAPAFEAFRSDRVPGVPLRFSMGYG